MKVTTIIYVISALVCCGCGGGKDDSVYLAHQENLNSAIDEQISSFMTKAADAHMLALKEAELATTKASQPQIREFAQWMIAEQTRLLQNLRMLAAQKNITLPQKLGNRSAENYEDLSEEEDFDRAFVRAMQKEYEDAVDIFEDGTDVRDQDVQLFAKSNLPVVEAHVVRIDGLHYETDRVNSVSEDGNKN